MSANATVRVASMGDAAAEYLRPLRVIFGESRRAQAERLGLSEQTLAALEGRRRVEPDNLRALLRKHYGLPAAALPNYRGLLVRVPSREGRGRRRR
ncbi:MAG: hypothetical protein AAGM38_09855 [Pseudomonadota bacterium]